MDDHRYSFKGNKAALELDRFNRRLIKSVARLLLHEKKPESEVWKTLKRDTGCNCELLWTRMRALTLKKLERHFIAEDRVDRVPRRARMNLTDWLMVDLVLVHQDLDFIGQDLNLNENFAPLEELFNLVNMFGIEGLKGEALAEAWSSATLYYNTNGHQCSPMLLQKRWYQMKAITRSKFYNFWYAYKGCIKRLHVAEPYKPTPLEHAIARRYKELITKPHLSWTELIEQRLVTLPDEFERKMIERAGSPMDIRRQSHDDASDLELVEPVVETIDLRQESDETLQGESNNDETLPRIVKVKQEPPDPDLEPQPQVEPKKSIYQEVLESTLKENQVIDAMLNSGYFDDYNDEEKDLEEVDLEEKEKTMMPQITCVFSNVSESNLHNYSGTDKNTLAIGDGIDSDTSKLDNTDTVTNEVDVEPVTDDNQTRTVDVDGEIETVEGDVINLDVAKEGNNVVEETKDVVEDDNVTDTVKIDSKTVTVQDRDGIVTIDEDDLTNADKGNDNNVTELVEENTQINKDDIVTEETPVADLVAPISKGDNIIDNESVHEENLVQNENKNVEDGEETGSISKPVIITDSEDENSDAIVEPMDTALDYSATEIAENTVPEDTGDFKTTNEDIDCKANVKVEALKYSFGEIPNEFSFVDDGIELVDDGIAFEDYDDQIDIKTEPEPEEPKIDPKLLMVPVVYITRLDDLKIFRMSPFDKIRNKNIIDAVTMKNLPIKKEKISEKETEDVIENNPNKPADDDIENMSTDEDSNDSVVPENMRVKPTSYLLQKPRCRSYNPIQLCKNPDFNTRLKRLTVGFFKSHRNRALIKHCKPLTIDISKAFETKLVKGTLYLKRSEISDVNITTEITDDSEIVQSATVVPSAMIAQSLIDNTKTADILPLIREAEAPPKPIEHERNTRINLPDISEIRRINQRLLIAEISPIQIQNRTFKAPVTLVSNSDPQSPAVSNPTPDVTEVQTVASNYTSCQVVNSLPEPSIRGRAGVLRGRGRGSFSWRSFVQQKPKPKSVKSYTTITWLSKSNDPNIISKQQECTLLTLDTLNKMLNLLGDKEGPSDTQKKSKFTVESTEKKLDKDLLQDGNKIETGVVCKPRINVKSAVNGPRQYKPRKKRVIVNVTNKTVPVNEERQKRKGLYCCWCRKRLLQMILDKKYVRGHDCPEGNCVCCCRKLLSSYILQDEKIKAAQQNADKNMATIQCAEAASACANITKDIPKDAQNQAGPAVTKVSATDIIMPSVSTVTVDSGGQFDIHLPKESSTLGSEVTVAASSKEPATTPFVENVSVAKNPTIAVPLVNTLVSPMIEAQPVLQPITDVNLKKFGVLKTFINSSGKKPNRSTLTKSNKPFKPPKFLKEKLIFLNSKHISDKPAKSPIYLGKNKVLMTTIKFPWNLKLFEETKKALAPTLKLPAGVSLVCLPDGTISYSIDNNHVKALDLALMPSIIATVQMHMNNALQQHRLQLQQNVQPTVNSSEVIDLVDDEDEDENKTKNVLDINNSRNANEIENVVLTKTTCTEDNAQEASREEMPIATAEQLVHTDVSPSREVAIEKESKHPDSSFTSGCQLQPLSIDDANSKKSELKLPEDQIKPCHANLPESIEATLESEQSVGNEDKAEQEVLVAQAPSSSSQADSVTDTQEMPKVPGQPNQTEANASQESKPPEVQSQPDQLIEKPPSENIADSDQNTQQPKKTKNILSDLMEMSGIFDDDVTPPPPVTLPTPAQQAQASQSLLSQLGASPQPVGTSKLQGTLLGPIPNLISCQPLIKTPLGDLSPVTSLYELKYACANKGIFFKLDCDTGYLVPINVCLKAPVKQQKVKVIAERTVIDLTEEGKSNQSEPNLSPEKGLVSDTEGSNSPVKPVSLLKVAVPSILRRLNTNNKSKEKINKGIKAAGDKVIKKKRKQQLQQYDLSDDNEDNIAQSSSKKATKRSKGADTQELSADKLQQDEVTTLYDSSDDEPLSKVAKLKRQEEEESLSKEKQMTKIVAEMPTTEQDEKLDDNLDTEENISESDQSHSSDDDRENCILGV